jgi:hypothetical protein
VGRVRLLRLGGDGQHRFLLVAGFMLLGVLGAVLQLVRLGSYPKEERPVGFALAGLALPIGLFLAWVGAFMVHTAAYVPSYMGRRHRKGRKLLAPETEAGAAWIGAEPTPLALGIPEEERDALGAEWRDNGKKEHASVAAFAQLTLDLMAVGAPPELVAAAQRDALDEVRHAAACFAIARDIDGLAESPSPFPDARAVDRADADRDRRAGRRRAERGYRGAAPRGAREEMRRAGALFDLARDGSGRVTSCGA